MPAKVIEPGPVHHGYNDLFSTLLRACAKDDIAVVISLLEAGVGVPWGARLALGGEDCL
jgi:hypothetical protein